MTQAGLMKHFKTKFLHSNFNLYLVRYNDNSVCACVCVCVCVCLSVCVGGSEDENGSACTLPKCPLPSTATSRKSCRQRGPLLCLWSNREGEDTHTRTRTRTRTRTHTHFLCYRLYVCFHVKCE